jgi:pimeloyl-ACP methyl ester carboxylesterase
MTNLVLIHGAWASGWAWEPLLPHLNSSDTQCHVINLPDSESYDASLQSQVGIKEYTSQVLKVITEIDGPVWLIGHSGGGLTATAVAEKIPNKIAGLIYVAGMMLPSGMSFTELCQTVSKKGIDTQGIAPYLQNTQYGTEVKEEGIREIFLHDATEQAIKLAKENMVVQPNASRVISINWTPEGVGSIPKYYIIAERDRSLVPDVQQEMIKRVSPNAVVSLNCGHFPQIVVPEQLAKVIVGFIKDKSL